MIPMSAAKAPAFCCSTLGHVGLPAEASEHRLAVRLVESGTRWARPRCRRRRVLRIGQVEDVVGGHALEQPDAEDRGCDPGRDEHAVDGLAVARRAPRRWARGASTGAVGVLPGLLGPGDDDGALDRHAADGPVLELAAELAVGLELAVGADDAQPEQQAPLGIVGVRGRLAPAVAEVARRARLRVEERSEPVTPRRRRRRGDPVVVEEVVADGKGRAAARRSRPGHRLGEGA